MSESRRREPIALRPFTSASTLRHRRRRLAFAAVYFVAAIALLWPVYPRFAGAFPLILGLPLSLAWILGALVVVFVALLLLYLAERRDAERGDLVD